MEGRSHSREAKCPLEGHYSGGCGMSTIGIPTRHVAVEPSGVRKICGSDSTPALTKGPLLDTASQAANTVVSSDLEGKERSLTPITTNRDSLFKQSSVTEGPSVNSLFFGQLEWEEEVPIADDCNEVKSSFSSNGDCKTFSPGTVRGLRKEEEEGLKEGGGRNMERPAEDPRGGMVEERRRSGEMTEEKGRNEAMDSIAARRTKAAERDEKRPEQTYKEGRPGGEGQRLKAERSLAEVELSQWQALTEIMNAAARLEEGLPRQHVPGEQGEVDEWLTVDGSGVRWHETAPSAHRMGVIQDAMACWGKRARGEAGGDLRLAREELLGLRLVVGEVVREVRRKETEGFSDLMSDEALEQVGLAWMNRSEEWDVALAEEYEGEAEEGAHLTTSTPEEVEEATATRSRSAAQPPSRAEWRTPVKAPSKEGEGNERAREELGEDLAARTGAEWRDERRFPNPGGAPREMLTDNEEFQSGVVAARFEWQPGAWEPRAVELEIAEAAAVSHCSIVEGVSSRRLGVGKVIYFAVRGTREAIARTIDRVLGLREKRGRLLVQEVVGKSGQRKMTAWAERGHQAALARAHRSAHARAVGAQTRRMNKGASGRRSRPPGW